MGYPSDLSPIEHLWDEMDRRVRGRRNAPATLGQLRAALLEEWDNIPMRRINKKKCRVNILGDLILFI
jgi:transposase